jgi:acyl-CoA synthetase (NDP forming)
MMEKQVHIYHSRKYRQETLKGKAAAGKYISGKEVLLSSRHNIDGLKPFFEPESVAVIGASRTVGKGGYNIVENLVRLGYKGDIYPVNPRAKDILGVKAYPDLSGIPGTPGLALIVVPPDSVVASLQECIDKGIKAVIIETAGFGEMDRAGARIEIKLREMARQAGIRVMGPNSVGTINPYNGFDSSLGRLDKLFLPEDGIGRGSAGFIGQTGLFTGVYLPLINSEIGISKIACLGNKCDVDESDMLEYYGADPATRVIAMYLESIKDGRRFMKLAQSIIGKKPIVILKSAVTEGGAKASSTHTGAIAGEDRVYEAAFHQAGIIRAFSFEQLWDITRAFVQAPLPRGNRVAIINLAGSGCVTSVDAAVKNGLKIAAIGEATKEKIKPVYPDWWQVRSPIDVWTAIEASGFEKTYTTVTRAALEDDGVDAVMVVMGANDWLQGESVPALFKDIRKDFPEKPVLAVGMLGDRQIFHRMLLGFRKIGIPAYSSDEDAVTSLASLWRYRQHLDSTR